MTRSITTRRGYDSILDGVLLPRFGALPITAVDGEEVCQLDLDLSKPQKPAPKGTKGGRRKAKLTRGRRNNVQIVLRSVLRFAQAKGHLSAIPAGLPRFKTVEPPPLSG